jgi:hypothetical protein
VDGEKGGIPEFSGENGLGQLAGFGVEFAGVDALAAAFTGCVGADIQTQSLGG